MSALWNWAFRNNSPTKAMGMVIGGLAMVLAIVGVMSASGPGQASSDPVEVARAEHNRTLTTPNDPSGFYVPPVSAEKPDAHDGSAPQALGARPADLNNGPVAVRPLTVMPRSAPAWTPPVVSSTPHGRMTPTPPPLPSMVYNLGSPGPTQPGPGRRNIGCGFWPVGSDADRDCYTRMVERRFATGGGFNGDGRRVW
jgi:hypothetical protein